MKVHDLHSWDLTTAQARDLQLELAGRVISTKRLRRPRIIAATDASYDRGSPLLYAAVVVVDAASFEIIEQVEVVHRMTFPYVPGLFSFREAPALLDVFRRLETVPDVVLCDGQGLAHPRRVGFASHLGLCLNIPTIGCAKSRLCGEFDEPGPERGDRSPLLDRGERVGSVVRTKDRCRPLFVSVGHLCNLQSAERVVLESCTKYRLPEPARMAHRLVNELRGQNAQ